MPDNAQYIGISDNKLKHMRSVAEECYRFAKEKGMSEEEAQTAYVIGFNHDIGYAFSTNPEMHPLLGMRMLLGITGKPILEIGAHGNPDTCVSTDMLDILNRADMTVLPDGTKTTPKERLKDIEKRYGKNSDQYKDMTKLAKKLGLAE